MKHYCRNLFEKKFIYTDFVRDLGEFGEVLYIRYSSEYDGQQALNKHKNL